MPIKAKPALGRVSTDVLEGIGVAVRYRHQFDDASLGMAEDPRLLVEVLPAKVVRSDGFSYATQAFGHAKGPHDGYDIVGAQEMGLGGCRRVHGVWRTETVRGKTDSVVTGHVNVNRQKSYLFNKILSY